MSDDQVLYITPKVEELAQELMELTGNPVADTMNHILEEALSNRVHQLNLQKTCQHPSKHQDRKSGWWCHVCGLQLVDYVCPCTNTKETSQWGTVCSDCGKTICKHKNRASYQGGGWYCTDCKRILT